MRIIYYIIILQVILLWRRAIDDPGFKRIFCLVHAEKLLYQVSEECVRSLLWLKQEKDGIIIYIINTPFDKSLIGVAYMLRIIICAQCKFPQHNHHLGTNSIM